MAHSGRSGIAGSTRRRWRRRITGLAATVPLIGIVAGVIVLSGALPAGAGTNLVQSRLAILASPGSMTVMLPAPARAGDLLVATGFVWPNTAAGTVSAPPGFVSIGSSSGNSAAGGAVAWYKVAAGGESAFSFSESVAGAYSEFGVHEFSGLTDPVLDGTPSWQNSTSSVSGYTQASATNPSASGDLVLAFFGSAAATAQTTPTGWALIAAPPTSRDNAGYYYATAGSTPPSITTRGLTPAGAYVAGMALFRSGGSPSTTTTTSSTTTTSTTTTLPPTTTTLPPTTTTLPPTTTTAPQTGSGTVIAVDGDVQIPSSLSTSNAVATSDEAIAMSPTQAWLAGDEANDATMAEYNTYPSHWGRLSSVLQVVPGDHDALNRANYATYFASNGLPAARAETIAGWRVYFLDSEAAMGVGSATYNFVRDDLAAHPGQPIAAVWHEPRWSTDSIHGDNPVSADVWQLLYAAHADIVLNGAAHGYQRWAQLDPSGAASASGIREFVVGTGGAALYSWGRTDGRVEYRQNSSLGVLRLVLHPASYEWQFVSTSGVVMDASAAPVPTHNGGSGT